jgi:hypothetical protein
MVQMRGYAVEMKSTRMKRGKPHPSLFFFPSSCVGLGRKRVQGARNGQGPEYNSGPTLLIAASQEEF